MLGVGAVFFSSGGSDTWRSQLVTPDTFPRSAPGALEVEGSFRGFMDSLVQLQLLFRLPLNLDNVSLKHVLRPRFCSWPGLGTHKILSSKAGTEVY